MYGSISVFSIIPYNSPEGVTNARQRKETKENYQLSLSDVDARGLDSTLLSIDIRVLVT